MQVKSENFWAFNETTHFLIFCVCVCLQDIPRDIEENGHKAIFYLKQISSDKYMFESSLYPSYYLGFDHNSEEDYDTLIMRYKAEDEVDEVCNITLDEC